MSHPIKRAAAAGILGAAAVATLFVGNGLLSDVRFAHAQDQVQLSREKLETLNDLATAYKEVGRVVEPSVVNIVVQKKSPQVDRRNPLRRFAPNRDRENEDDDGSTMVGTGSGVIMDVEGDWAYIATNNHVAGDAKNIVVTLADGRRITEASVVGVDPKSDLAVVKIKAPRLIAAKWGDSDKLEKGDLICAFGSPFGYVGSMSHGIVSALNRNARVIENEYAYENFIQVDAPINPGNSGGPLVNLKGEVVGINTAIASRTGGFQGIGFAIPSNQVRGIYNQLKGTGRVVRGWLGVQIADVKLLSPEAIEAAGLKDDSGVLVNGAVKDAPALGILKPGDVIKQIDGKPVKDVNELRNTIALMPPGKDVKFGIYRNGKDDSVTVKLGEQPGDAIIASADVERDAPVAAVPSGETLGVVVEAADADKLDALDVPADTKGVVISAVRPDSLAALAGLRPGEVITRVGDANVVSPEEVAAAVKAGDFSKGLRLDLVSKDGERMVIVKKSK